jgi:hypothetical protein
MYVSKKYAGETEKDLANSRQIPLAPEEGVVLRH